jgi:hypothetical protein
MLPTAQRFSAKRVLRQHRLHDCYLFSHPSKNGLIASRFMTVDGADEADAIFGTRAHPDHSSPSAAFPGKRDDQTGRERTTIRSTPRGHTTVHASVSYEQPRRATLVVIVRLLGSHRRAFVH